MNDDRRNRIIRLLETRDDGLPEPRATQIRGAAPGFAHKTVVALTCPDCLANDRPIPGCETCRGTGRIEVFRERDPYAETTVAFAGLDGSRHDHRYARDTEIQQLASQTAPGPKTEADDLAATPPDRWEIERRRMYRDHDYAALDRALEVLRHEQPSLCGIVHSVYVYGIVEASAVMEELSERALRFIDERMPDEIRAPGFRHPQQDAIERRRSVA